MGQKGDVQGAQELGLFAFGDGADLAGLAGDGGGPGDELPFRYADGGHEAGCLPQRADDALSQVQLAFVVEGEAAGVQIGAAESAGLDFRAEGFEDGEHGVEDVAVARGMRRQEDGVAAEGERRPERHADAHALRLGFGRAVEDGFSLVGRLADDERAAAEGKDRAVARRRWESAG